MKYLKIFEDFERGTYTKISLKTLQRGNDYLKEVCPFLNIDLFEDVELDIDRNFLFNGIIYDSVEAIIDSEFKKALIIWDYRKHKYTINNDLIDVDGNVRITEKIIAKLPYKFGKVIGDFYCAVNRLTTLNGSPHTVDKNFNCYGNLLTTLEGSPHTVGGDFNCSNNRLTTLEGAPEIVGKSFDCGNNLITNLKYLPKVLKGCIYYGGNINFNDTSDVPEEWKHKLIER